MLVRMEGKIIAKNNGGEVRYIVACGDWKMYEIADQTKIKPEMVNKKCFIDCEQDILLSLKCGREKIFFEPKGTKSGNQKDNNSFKADTAQAIQQRGRSLQQSYENSNQENRKLQSQIQLGKKGPLSKAFAPYNFVPLNTTIVPSDHEQIPSFAVYSGLSGYIDLEIEALTPLYVGGTEKNRENEKQDNKKIDRKFFGPNGIPRIPGSSLRGLVRTMVEVISYSKIRFIDRSRVLYYRAVADSSSLGSEYKDNFICRNPVTKKRMPKFCAGYLIQRGTNYYIIPAKIEKGKQYVPVKKGITDEEFTIKTCGDKYRVISGNIEGKQHDWLINSPDGDQEEIKIPRQDIEFYKNDANRMVDNKVDDNQMKKDGNLLRILRYCPEKQGDGQGKKEKFVPCFYVQWKDSDNNDRVSFGHTAYFRLAYKLSIGDHLKVEHKNSKVLDIATAIFGISEKGQSDKKENNSADLETTGRVYFDDAVLIDNPDAVTMKPMSPRVLATPKPTCIQHYLTQPSDASARELKHWNNPEAILRGNKFYWHKKISSQDRYTDNNSVDWRERELQYESSQHTVIKPLKEKSNFKGRIRFENLSEVELGALLFVLDLPEGHYHKIGMGKPLGMGSIKIETELYLCDRQDRYESLFKDGSFYLAVKKKERKGFMKIFEDYVLSKLPQEEKINGSLWATPRLRELKIMLDWNHDGKVSNWRKKTSYMLVGSRGYKDRNILSQAHEVAKRDAE